MSRKLATLTHTLLRSRQFVSPKISTYVAKSFPVCSPVAWRSFSSSAKPEPFLGVKETTDRVIEVLKNFEKVNGSKVTPAARFKEDLDLDSLDAVEVVMAIEEEFSVEIPDSEADKILSVADAVAYISGHPMAK